MARLKEKRREQTQMGTTSSREKRRLEQVCYHLKQKETLKTIQKHPDDGEKEDCKGGNATVSSASCPPASSPSLLAGW